MNDVNNNIIIVTWVYLLNEASVSSLYNIQ